MNFSFTGVAFFKAELANAASTVPLLPPLHAPNNVEVDYNPLPAPTTEIIRYNI